jgi:hypothetical protein
MFRACDQRFDLTGTLKNFYELNKARICDGVVHFWLRPDLNLSFFLFRIDLSLSCLRFLVQPIVLSLSNLSTPCMGLLLKVQSKAANPSANHVVMA